jgi:hypothetical protein
MFENRGWFNDLQIRYYQTFMTNSIRRIKAEWPGLDERPLGVSRSP